MAKRTLSRSRAQTRASTFCPRSRASTLIATVAVHWLLGCEPSEPDPVPVEGGIQHPVREAGTPPGEAGVSDGGLADAGLPDPEDAEVGDR